jgi:hypothetical protein
MKCSGARDTRQGVKPCGRLAIPAKFDAFCCEEHQTDARLYVGEEAYQRHVQHFRNVAQSRNKKFTQEFNKKERVMFVSMIEARQVKLHQEYQNTIGAEYAQGVLTAWSGVADSSGASPSYVLTLQTVNELKQAVKRKSYDSLSDVLFGRPSSTLLLTDGRTSSFSSKKSRTDSHASDLELLGYTVDEPDEVTSPTTPAPPPHARVPVDTRNGQYDEKFVIESMDKVSRACEHFVMNDAVNAPLPDADAVDDDLMSE